MTEDVEAERAYWDASAVGNGRGELFSVPGIDGWEAGIDACLAQIVPALTPALRKGGRILDLGCGPGRLTFPLAERFPDATIIGVDLSPKMIHTARNVAEEMGVPNTRFMIGNGRTLPRTLARLAGAFSVLTLQHLPAEAQEGYVRSIAAKLEPDGVVRLQFVMSEVDHFLSHGVRVTAVEGWCRDAGLAVTMVDFGNVDESWAWVTAGKP